MLLVKILVYVSYFAILFGLLVAYPLYRWHKFCQSGHQMKNGSANNRSNKSQTKPV